MASHRVAEGTQVHLDGVTYVGGQNLPADADPGLVYRWLAEGWVVEVTPPAARKASRRTAKRA